MPFDTHQSRHCNHFGGRVLYENEFITRMVNVFFPGRSAVHSDKINCSNLKYVPIERPYFLYRCIHIIELGNIFL